MPTKLWAVRSALVDLFAEASTVPVSDGPLGRTTAPRSFLLVGTSGGDVGSDDFGFGDINDDASTVEQELSDIGPGTWRDEHGSILCAAWAWHGNADFAPLRTTISGIVDVAEAGLRADRSLGGLLQAPGLAEFSDLRFSEQQTKKGAVARATFTVSYGALLTL